MTYKIRLGGTADEFVSAMPLTPFGEVKFVEGWTNPDALVWKTKEEVKNAQNMVWEIEGFHTTIEEMK